MPFGVERGIPNRLGAVFPPPRLSARQPRSSRRTLCCHRRKCHTPEAALSACAAFWRAVTLTRRSWRRHAKNVASLLTARHFTACLRWPRRRERPLLTPICPQTRKVSPDWEQEIPPSHHVNKTEMTKRAIKFCVQVGHLSGLQPRCACPSQRGLSGARGRGRGRGRGRA